MKKSVARQVVLAIWDEIEEIDKKLVALRAEESQLRAQERVLRAQRDALRRPAVPTFRRKPC